MGSNLIVYNYMEYVLWKVTIPHVKATY